MGFEDRRYDDSERTYRPGPKFIFPMPSILTFVLLITCTVIFLIQSYAAPVTGWGVLTFRDLLAFKQPWRWITYQYLHGGGGHLFFNLISIYFLVPALEQRWGWRRTFAFYT